MVSGKPVNSVGLVIAPHKPEASKVAQDLTASLRERGVSVRACHRAAKAIGDGTEPAEITDVVRADLVIVLGGDGTLLRYAGPAATVGTPLLGVYMGGCGFLTATDPASLSQRMDSLLQGDYLIEERMMLSAELPSGSSGDAIKLDALNDIVVHRGTVGRRLECDVSIDGHQVGLYRGDGLIIATSTGSTAYSLSAGGPVIEPNVDCIVLTPMCLQSPSIRPMVVGPDSTITVKVVGGYFVMQTGATVTADGHSVVPLDGGSTVTIRQSANRVRLCALGDSSFVDRLRQKLGWGWEA